MDISEPSEERVFLWYPFGVMPNKLILFLAAALVAAAFPIDAQQFVPKSIQFKGDPDHSTEEMLAASGLKKGAVLTYAQMNDVSKRLMDTGMFASLTFKFDGQDLIFQLTPSDQLLPIHLDNLPIAPGTDVDAKLHQQFPLYHGKISSDGDMMEQVRAAIEKILGDQGIKATILATQGADPKTRHVSSIHYTIASPPVQIQVSKIDGASSDLQEKLGGISKEAAKTPFDIDNSAPGIEHLFTVFYQDRGFAAVKVVASRAGNPIPGPDAIVVPFDVHIEEGRVYKIGTVHLPDNAPVTAAEVAKTLAAAPNGPVEGVRVRTLWTLIASRYRSKGYLDCKLTPTPHFDESSATVNYDLAVDPGPVYHLGFVKFDNVSDDVRVLLMRNWQLMPGEPFDEAYVGTFIPTVQKRDPQLRATLNNVKFSFDATADPQTHDVNVVIHLAKQ